MEHHAEEVQKLFQDALANPTTPREPEPTMIVVPHPAKPSGLVPIEVPVDEAPEIRREIADRARDDAEAQKHLDNGSFARLFDNR